MLNQLNRLSKFSARKHTNFTTLCLAPYAVCLLYKGSDKHADTE